MRLRRRASVIGATVLVLSVVAAGSAVARAYTLPLPITSSKPPTEVAVVPPASATLHNAGLSMSHGMLRHLLVGDASAPDQRYRLQNHAVRPDSTATGPQPDGGTLDPTADSCATGIRCVRTFDGNSYGMVYLATAADGSVVVKTRNDNSATDVSYTLPATGGQLVDVSSGYVVVNTTNPAKQYVVDLRHNWIPRSGVAGAAALWYDTLWVPGPKPGDLTPLDVRVGVQLDVVTGQASTGTACVPTELQATARWVYWSCGPSGPRGVYDTVTRGSLPLPSITGPALLGDGYLVWHDSAAGALNMVDFHNARAVPDQTGIPTRPTTRPATTVVKLASLPAGPVADDRGITWAVDKFGNFVAYVTADSAVHVLDTGVAQSPAVIGASDSWVPPDVWPRNPGGSDKPPTFNPHLLVSRPVSQWSLAITRDITGETVHTATGGAQREAITTTWDGTIGSGYALSGRYSWQLRVLPAGTSTWQVAGTGALRINCGAAPFRSYSCLGDAAFLTVFSTGVAQWFEAQPDGTVSEHAHSEDWPLGTGPGQYNLIVPFGDDNGDGNPDIIVRDSSGALYLCLGIGSAYFNNPVKTALGTGWNGYTLAYAGDINSDGIPDLLARDPGGTLWLYPGSGVGSLRARVMIGTGWNIYNRLVGAGDLNGDGVGDLLGVDAAGSLWRYQGDGTGGFDARVLVGTGWGAYNTLIGPGDLNSDGHNDLAARDNSGNLWLYPGDGTGGFDGRILRDTGFQRFQAMF